MTDTPNPQAGLARQALLAELDAAIDDHLDWLSQWHRRLFFSDPVDAGDIAWDPGVLCRFGSWYARNKHRPVVNQPAVRTLADRHEDLHGAADALAQTLRSGKPVNRGHYNVMINNFQSFVDQARRLEKAFSVAAADLDPLTGLYNRHALYRNLESERARADRTGRPLSVAMADLDRFKNVNDTYGHHVGDSVLATTAECFTTHMRPFDILYRFGGEEFLFTLPDADADAAARIMDRLRVALEGLDIDIGGGTVLRVTASFGVAAFESKMDFKEASERADAALYKAKESGRNRVCQWEPETG